MNPMIPPQVFSLVTTCPGNQFFGLVPWYHFLPDSDFQGCNVAHFTFLSASGPGDIPLILLAIIDDLLRVAGIAAVAYVVYGSIQYIASQGSPESTARAQSTIINALIGLAIAVIAIVFVSFLGAKLGG